MLSRFYPNGYADSVFAIDFEKLARLGYRGLIFDIDNTLVPHGDDSTPAVDALFAQLHALGFQTLLLSNNGEDRVLRFLKNIDSLYICRADKPAVAAYERALSMLALGKRQVLVIGDQMFTDILGANRAGLASIMVQYFKVPGERIGPRRRLENCILSLWRHTRRDQFFGEAIKHGR